MQTERLEVRASPSLSVNSRVGIVVPKYRRDIVDRNRTKRRLRELARTRLLPALKNTDLLLRAKPSAYSGTYEQLGQEIDLIADWSTQTVNRK